MKLRSVLQIIFCILSVASFLAGIFLGVFLGFLFALYGFCATLVFAGLMFVVKYAARKKPSQQPDFFNSPEENERLVAQSHEQENSSPEEK